MKMNQFSPILLLSPLSKKKSHEDQKERRKKEGKLVVAGSLVVFVLDDFVFVLDFVLVVLNLLNRSFAPR